MNRKQKAIDSLGICMYCGSTEDLTDEHIVPYAMGGTMILPRSSCKKCAVVTSLDERKVLRGFMYEARLVSGLPSRRKKKQPKTLDRIFLRDDGTEFTKELLVQNGVSVIHLPIFTEPGMFGSSSSQNEISIKEMSTIHLGANNYKELLKNEGATGFKFDTKIDVSSFCRVLSKIAYGFHVLQEGPFPREESPALSIIFKEKIPFARLIGSRDISYPESKKLHLLQMYKYPSDDGSVVAYVVAINLFRGWGMSSSYLVTTRICPLA